MWQLLASQLTLNIRLHCSCLPPLCSEGSHTLTAEVSFFVVGCALTCADHELQGILRCEMQGLNTKNKNVRVLLMYVACSMCHSFYLQLFTQSWSDKRCMHSVSPPSATRFASISVDMCARVSCKRVHRSMPHDSSLNAFRSPLLIMAQ